MFQIIESEINQNTKKTKKQKLVVVNCS